MIEQQGYNVAESQEDLENFMKDCSLVWVEYYKEGVKRIWMKKQINGEAHYLVPIYAKTEFTKNIEGE